MYSSVLYNLHSVILCLCDYVLSLSLFLVLYMSFLVDRFREATDTVKAGLQSLNCKHRRVDPIYWPGTKTVISECNQQHVKV